MASLLFGVVALLSLVLPMISNDAGTYAGYQVLFPYEISSLELEGFDAIASATLPFNALSIIAYLLVVVGIVTLVVNKKLELLSVIAFTAAGVMMVMIPSNVDMVLAFVGQETTISPDWSFGYGLILGMTTVFLAALSALFYLINP